MEYLVVYDISHPRRLRRVARIMERYGERVQKSVFECNLAGGALDDMQDGVRHVMDTSDDTLRIYPMLAGSRVKQTIIGTGAMVRFPQAYIV